MYITRAFAFSIVATALIQGCSSENQKSAPNMPLKSSTSFIKTMKVGQQTLYVTSEGRSIYLQDTLNDDQTETCDAVCQQNFSPLLAEGSPNPEDGFEVVKHPNLPNGQWAVHGKLLYVHVGDKTVGSMQGEAMENRWFTAKPVPAKIQTITSGVFSGEAITGNFSIKNTDGIGRPGNEFVDISNATFYSMPQSTNCIDNCAERWKPVFVAQGTTINSPYSVLTRNDGSHQLAYANQALYWFSSTPLGTSGAGEITQIGDLTTTWYVVRPLPLQTTNGDFGPLITAAHSVLTGASSGNSAGERINKDGVSLYTFDDDTAYDSECNDECATVWPPLFADEHSVAFGAFSTFQRRDGSRQWAYKLKPLYFYSGDRLKGEHNGDGLNENKWHLARPVPFQLVNTGNGNFVWVSQGSVSNVDDNGGQDSTNSDKSDYAVYRFDEDQPGVSNCNAGCAVTWPPVFASSELTFGEFSVIRRADNAMQWAYKGAPLYFYSGDNLASDRNGVYGTWHLVSR